MVSGQAAGALRRQDAFGTTMTAAATTTTTTMTMMTGEQQQQRSTAPVERQPQQLGSSNRTANESSSGGSGGGNSQIDHQAKRYRPQKFCSVCGDKAIACNFNAVTCESCKAFFRRNAYKEQRLKCLFEGRCLITKDTRRFCSKCRLLKCFTTGMKREWILTDEQKHTKRVKIIQNKETKMRQLASISSTQTPTPKTSCSSSQSAPKGHFVCGSGGVGGSIVTGHHQLYNGRNVLNWSSPIDGVDSTMHQQQQQHQQYCGTSEASSPNNTPTKNSLCSSREASISRSDSRCDQHQLAIVTPPPPIVVSREVRTFVETRDASTWTSAQPLQPVCSWSSDCHYCAVKLSDNNSEAAAALATSASLDLIHHYPEQSTNITTTGLRNDNPIEQQNHHSFQSTDELGSAIHQMQLTPSGRLFYSAPVANTIDTGTGGGADDENNSSAKQHLQNSMSAYVTSGGGVSTEVGGDSSHHLFQLTTSGNGGSPVSRPVTNYCFNAAAAAAAAAANAGRLAAAAAMHENHHHGSSAPMNLMAADDSLVSRQQQQQQQQHYNMTTDSGAYLSGTTDDSGISSAGNNSSLLCFPLTNHTTNNPSGRNQQATPTNHHQPHHNHHHSLMSSPRTSAMIPTCFVPATPPDHHFNFPAFGLTATNNISTSFMSGGGGTNQPTTKSSAYDLQVAAIAQQQHCDNAPRIDTNEPSEANMKQDSSN